MRNHWIKRHRAKEIASEIKAHQEFNRLVEMLRRMSKPSLDLGDLLFDINGFEYPHEWAKRYDARHGA